MLIDIWLVPTVNYTQYNWSPLKQKFRFKIWEFDFSSLDEFLMNLGVKIVSLHPLERVDLIRHLSRSGPHDVGKTSMCVCVPDLTAFFSIKDFCRVFSFTACVSMCVFVRIYKQKNNNIDTHSFCASLMKVLWLNIT